jgi:hypothetical protein
LTPQYVELQLKPIHYPPFSICPLWKSNFLSFIAGTLIGRTTGYWQTAISSNEYLFHARNLDMPFYQHNRGEVPDYNMSINPP